MTRYEANRVDLKTASTDPSIVVLSENSYPGWRVYVDDQASEILRVDYNLRGVQVPAGEHRVSFVYRPWSVMGGLLVSLLTATVLIVLSVGRKSVNAAH